MYLSGLWKNIPASTFRVLIGEAITTIQAQAVLQLTVTSIALATATAASVSVFHFSRKS